MKTQTTFSDYAEKTNIFNYKKVILALLLLAYVPLSAQDYVIDRGIFSGFYTGSRRMCVVDKNEYFAPYFVSPKVTVRHYKNGNVSDWGNASLLPDGSSSSDIARNPVDSTVYISFINSAYDKILTYKRGPQDDDWQYICAMDKPSTYLVGYTIRLSFNLNSQTLFMSFNERTTNKVYLFELVEGVWTNRAGATTLSSSSNRIDLVSYGNKVIVSTSPYSNLQVHVYDISTTTLTSLNQNINNVAGFVTTAYDTNTNTYVSFFAESSPWMNVKVMQSLGGADWTDITGTLTGAMDNGSWGGYIVYNETMSKFSLFFSTGFIKGYYWSGTDWTAISLPYMASTDVFAIPHYKDVYYLAWSSYTPVGIYSTNETPVRNTMNISTTPSTTSCTVNFPQRGDGNKVVVFVKKSDTYDTPVLSDFTTYTANPVFRSGSQLGSSEWYCVYNGVGDTITITSLDPNATYQLQAFEYNGNAAYEMYSPSSAVSGNPVSFVASSVLPVRWLSFSAKEWQQQIQLNWSTADELNNEGYVVERSYNGQLFESIGYVPANEQQVLIHEYTFIDNTPLKNGGYYRIKQIDRDGHASYSSIIQIRGVATTGIVIASNPSSGTIHITLPDGYSGVQLDLFDLSGHKLVQKAMLAGRNDIDIKRLTKAIYIVKVYNNSGILATGRIVR